MRPCHTFPCPWPWQTSEIKIDIEFQHELQIHLNPGLQAATTNQLALAFETKIICILELSFLAIQQSITALMSQYNIKNNGLDKLIQMQIHHFVVDI